MWLPAYLCAVRLISPQFGGSSNRSSKTVTIQVHLHPNTFLVSSHVNTPKQFDNAVHREVSCPCIVISERCWELATATEKTMPCKKPSAAGIETQCRRDELGMANKNCLRGSSDTQRTRHKERITESGWKSTFSLSIEKVLQIQNCSKTVKLGNSLQYSYKWTKWLKLLKTKKRLRHLEQSINHVLSKWIELDL